MPSRATILLEVGKPIPSRGSTKPRHAIKPSKIRDVPWLRYCASPCHRSVESRCGAVALGRTYLLPPLSSGGALMVPPWLRFHIPLIEPDRQISRIRLSDKTSRLHFRVQRLLQFLNTHRSL